MTNAVSTPLLEVKGLSVDHGRIRALESIELTVHAGELVTVIGPNGAGKSTLLNAIAGVLPQTSGTIEFESTSLPPGSIAARVQRGLSLVPEQRALFGTMNVADNLALGAWRFASSPAAERNASLDEVYALFPRLQERRRQAANTLSGGERQMLALGRALMGRPSLLMLDEPSLGLAPLIVRDIFRIIDTLRQRGVAILLVEQNARAALKLAQRGYVLELGRIVNAGQAEDLANDGRIVEAYLGLGAHQRKLVA